MTDLTPELGLDVIDEWFKIGKKSVQKNLKTVPRSVTGGRYFDTTTQRPRVAETENTFHPQRYSFVVAYQSSPILQQSYRLILKEKRSHMDKKIYLIDVFHYEIRYGTLISVFELFGVRRVLIINDPLTEFWESKVFLRVTSFFKNINLKHVILIYTV